MKNRRIAQIDGANNGYFLLSGIGGERETILAAFTLQKECKMKKCFWQKGVDGGAKNWYTQKGRARAARFLNKEGRIFIYEYL